MTPHAGHIQLYSIDATRGAATSLGSVSQETMPAWGNRRRGKPTSAR
jgi:hypothetical protein